MTCLRLDPTEISALVRAKKILKARLDPLQTPKWAASPPTWPNVVALSDEHSNLSSRLMCQRRDEEGANEEKAVPG